MNRSISISTDVFAAIWSNRKGSEQTEDDILRRLLGCEGKSNSVEGQTAAPQEGGLHDSRNGVYFPEGFRIFRTYKRSEYSAEARGGAWVRLDNGERYLTLNQLNSSIAAGAENVWNGTWRFIDDDGANRSIDVLRGQ